jgi:hypothetical protein
MQRSCQWLRGRLRRLRCVQCLVFLLFTSHVCAPVVTRQHKAKVAVQGAPHVVHTTKPQPDALAAVDLRFAMTGPGWLWLLNTGGCSDPETAVLAMCVQEQASGAVRAASEAQSQLAGLSAQLAAANKARDAAEALSRQQQEQLGEERVGGVASCELHMQHSCWHQPGGVDIMARRRRSCWC